MDRTQRDLWSRLRSCGAGSSVLPRSSRHWFEPDVRAPARRNGMEPSVVAGACAPPSEPGHGAFHRRESNLMPSKDQRSPASTPEPAEHDSADRASSPMGPLLWILIPFALLLLYGAFSSW